MGMSAASSVSEAMKLCIFDLRRGQHEGQELDKILYFFPADLPFPTQLSVIGLSEGLITFTRIFSPEAPCEVIEAEMHSHVFYEAEPDIWMVMVVEKSDSEAIWRTSALRSVLKEVHSIFVMFHGSIRALLDREPSGGLTRTHLYYFIMDYLSDFLSGKKLVLPNFRDSLKERGMVQMLTIGREAALEVQASPKIFKVEEKLSRGWGGENAYHVSGYRYLLVDGDRSISRASPPGKVTTLAKDSLVAMSKLREEVDLEKSRAKCDDSDCEKDQEICIRAKNGAWVISRLTRGKELCMVLEKANETLLYASEAVEKFSDSTNLQTQSNLGLSEKCEEKKRSNLVELLRIVHCHNTK